MTYWESEHIKRTTFLTMPAEDEPVPKYEKIAHLLPTPVWKGRDDESMITAICEKPIEIEVHYGDKIKIIRAKSKA